MTTIEKARELGVALANSPEFLRLTEARERMDANAAVTKLLQEYHLKEHLIVSMMEQDDVSQEGAVMLTADMERIKAQLLANETFSELMASQQAFSGLLTEVNREINACIGIEESEVSAKASCNGSCEHCNGCAH